MSTGITVQCRFVLSPCVLCIVLTNPQNHWATLKKKKRKKGRKLNSVYLFFVDQIIYMKACNPAEWSICKFLA